MDMIELARELGRKPNSIRNFYYAQLRAQEAGAMGRALPFETFAPGEVEQNIIRYLKQSGTPAILALNKVDLYRESHAEMLEAFHEIYEGAGYPVMEVSALTGEGVDALREACSGHVSLFSGVSGVGKSSLIKALDPSLDPRVGEISDVHLQGKHTTTFYEMYALSTCHSEQGEESNGFIVDTPGLRGFGLVDLKKEEIALYFPEMLRVSENCRFAPCTHTHEPGCAVKEAVEAGEISYDRYSSYLGMLDEEGKYR